MLAGIDSPALLQLAGLTRSEEQDAHDLFDQTIAEFGIAPQCRPTPRPRVGNSCA